jgi:hypothetical protein
MKWWIDDRLPKSTRKSALKISGALLDQNRVTSELYFAKSTKHLIDTAHMSRFETREMTIIYLSFTSVRISIAVPGCGVSLEGGTPSRRGMASKLSRGSGPDSAVWHDNRAKPVSGR